MATHIQQCKASDGWDWLVKGIRLFKKKPGELFLVGNTYLFVVLLITLMLPFVGAVIVTLITPGLSAGVMIAGRMATKGLRVSPATLFAGFTENKRANAQKLMILGAIYACCFALIKLFVSLILGPEPQITLSAAELESGEIPVEWINYLANSTMLMAISLLPVILAFWYAPALVVWHGMKPGKALFASTVAVWRNKGAFLTYGMGWMVLVIGTASVLAYIFVGLGFSAGLSGAANMLSAAFITSVSIGTVYPTYQSVFEHDPGEHVDLMV